MKPRKGCFVLARIQLVVEVPLDVCECASMGKLSTICTGDKRSWYLHYSRTLSHAHSYRPGRDSRTDTRLDTRTIQYSLKEPPITSPMMKLPTTVPPPPPPPYKTPLAPYKQQQGTQPYPPHPPHPTTKHTRACPIASPITHPTLPLQAARDSRQQPSSGSPGHPTKLPSYPRTTPSTHTLPLHLSLPLVSNQSSAV